MTLYKRKLGSQGLEVSAIGLGCMPMSQSYGPADEKESIATMKLLDDALSPENVSEQRYPDWIMATIDR